MKKLLLFVLIISYSLLNTDLFAQAPNAIPYQGVARNAAGNILASQSISLRISIHDATATGTVVYSETHAVTTTALGLFNVNIGSGTTVTGVLAAVNWGSGAKFIQVEMDPSGGSSYADMGTTQLNSVPYALYAASGGSSLAQGAAPGNTMRWNGTAWVADNAIYNDGNNVGIGTTTPGAKLEVAGGVKISDSINIGGQVRIMSGAPDVGKVLTSDATGLASWTTPLTPSVPDALPTIQIGTQKWTKYNLDVAFYRNGDPIPQVTDPTAWAGLTTGAWCYYNNDSTQGNKYGKLYNWYAVNDPRGLAPQGWHVPSDAEWTILETALGGSLVAGGKMKEAGTLNWTTPNTGGNNNSGFAGLPGGFRGFTGSFGFVGFNGYWWSSTGLSATFAWYRYLFYNLGGISRNNIVKLSGLSVRCLRD